MSSEERDLISNAHKQQALKTRETWRIVNALIEDPTKKYKSKEQSLKNYRKKLENRLYESCYAVVNDIKTFILSKKCDPEPRCFFLKMCADFLRYIAEVVDESRVHPVMSEAKSMYEEATKIALPTISIVKLQLQLNYSVFTYEILKNREDAIVIAEQTLMDSVDKLDDLNEKDFRDVKMMMDLIKRNL